MQDALDSPFTDLEKHLKHRDAIYIQSVTTMIIFILRFEKLFSGNGKRWLALGNMSDKIRIDKGMRQVDGIVASANLFKATLEHIFCKIYFIIKAQI